MILLGGGVLIFVCCSCDFVVLKSEKTLIICSGVSTY